MTLSTDDIDRLLVSLNDAARIDPYPSYGLPLYGATSRREALREIVQQWHQSIQPEAQR